MSKVVVTQELQAEVNGMLTFEWPHAEELLMLETFKSRPGIIEWCGLRRGDVVVFRTIEITATIEMVAEWRYGFNGQKRETTTGRKERVLEEDAPRKLWRTKKRGWYWITQGE